MEDLKKVDISEATFLIALIFDILDNTEVARSKLCAQCELKKSLRPHYLS